MAIEKLKMTSGEQTNNQASDYFIGHYRVLSKIGEGGMGEVYLAEDSKLDRRVAIKILNEKFAKHESNLNRFMQEAKAASALNHPNILVIHEIGVSEDTHYIVSEYIEGKTLRELIGKSPIKLPQVLDIAIQIANALVAAHTAKIIHRDIKPENIMIRSDDYVKVLDFGLAKLIEQKDKSLIDLDADTVKQNRTAEGMILGTINYMSPEQAKGEKVDEQTDIFSLGAVIYEMIAGKTPFAGDSMSETFANLINTEPPPLSRFAAKVPDELQRIVSKTLKKNKSERYQTMKDLVIDLRDLKQNLEYQSKFGISASGESIESKKTQILEGNLTEKKQFSKGETLYKKLALVFSALILLAAIGLGYRYFTNRISNTKQIESSVADTRKPALKIYWQMTEAEQLSFIKERAQHIQTLIGDEPTDFDEEALKAIKVEIDDYVEVKDSLSQKPFEEGLRIIYGRASQYAPIIIQAYQARQVPPAMGLYQAMIESEYHDCWVSKIGSVGLFQFTPETAAKYGLTPKDYCNVEKQSDAAARYMSDLSSDFVNGKSSATLGLLGFVIGENRVRDYLRQLRGRGIKERSFWTIFRYRQDLQPSLPEDVNKYVPHFFAAAIIGETPEAFELSTPPLTTLRRKSEQ
jgi:serine/threonine protein kinase